MIERIREWWRALEWPFMLKSTHYRHTADLHAKIRKLENELVSVKSRSGLYIV